MCHPSLVVVNHSPRSGRRCFDVADRNPGLVILRRCPPINLWNGLHAMVPQDCRIRMRRQTLTVTDSILVFPRDASGNVAPRLGLLLVIPAGRPGANENAASIRPAPNIA